jgi:hypothetical protein
VPRLAQAERFSLHLETDGVEPQLALREFGPRFPETVLFTLKTGGQVQIDAATPGSLDMAALDELSVVDGATSVVVHGPALTAVVVVEMDGSSGGLVRGSGTTDSEGLATVSLSQPLEMSKIYAARRQVDTEAQNPCVVPVMRWGADQTLSMFGGLQLRPFGNIGGGFHVGNADYYFSLRSEPAPNAVVALASYPTYLILGVHGVHPIVQTPQGPMLQGGWLGADSMDVIRTNGAAAIVDCPVPNDEGLEGLVILAQWVVGAPAGSPSDKFFLSDVVGLRIRRSPAQSPGQTAAAPASRTIAVAGAPSVTQQQRVASWMKNSRFRPVGDSFLRKIERGLDPR